MDAALAEDPDCNPFERRPLRRSEIIKRPRGVQVDAAPPIRRSRGAAAARPRLVEYEPYGTVLIIGAWNWPVLLRSRVLEWSGCRWKRRRAQTVGNRRRIGAILMTELYRWSRHRSDRGSQGDGAVSQELSLRLSTGFTGGNFDHARSTKAPRRT